VTREPGRTRAIALELTRPSDLHHEADWDAWVDAEHVPACAAASGAWAVTRWEVADRPPGASPPVGFTHVTIHELEDPDGGAALVTYLAGARDAGRLHPIHTITAVDVLAAATGWPGRLEPRAGVTGQVMAYVGPNDRRLDAEWNDWLSTMHIPDMLGSGGFTDASRWARVDPAPFGPNYLTIYDVEGIDVMEAVALSGAVMPSVHEQGRLMRCHSGGVRAALRPAGRWGPEGYRPA
jgi:hypothetical protein